MYLNGDYEKNKKTKRAPGKAQILLKKCRNQGSGFGSVGKFKYIEY